MAEIIPRAFAVYEDNFDWQTLFVRTLNRRGHTIPILIGDREEALHSVRPDLYREKNIFAALVDGKLISDNDGNKDGDDVVDALIGLASVGLDIHIISVASNRLLRAEFSMEKDVFDKNTLYDYLAKIGA